MMFTALCTVKKSSAIPIIIQVKVFFTPHQSISFIHSSGLKKLNTIMKYDRLTCMKTAVHQCACVHVFLIIIGYSF